MACLIIVIVFSVLISCGDSSYNKIKFYIDGIKVIDTHSHQGMPWRKKHNCFDSGMYLHADLISAGMPEYPDSMIAEHDAAAYWDYTEKYLRFCRGTSYYTQFVYNYKLLYGLDKTQLTKADFVNFSGQMDSNFKNYPVWLDSV